VECGRRYPFVGRRLFRRIFFFLSLNLNLFLVENNFNFHSQAAARAASAGADTPGGGLSTADLARLRAARAAEKEGAAGASSSSSGGGAGMGSGFFGDVLAEAKLIEWPSLKQALGDTVLVVGIVLGSALLLFVVNTLLADLSKVIY
jgi:preprotein translocase SecE subunit